MLPRISLQNSDSEKFEDGEKAELRVTGPKKRLNNVVWQHCLIGFINGGGNNKEEDRDQAAG